MFRVLDGSMSGMERRHLHGPMDLRATGTGAVSNTQSSHRVLEAFVIECVMVLLQPSKSKALSPQPRTPTKLLDHQVVSA